MQIASTLNARRVLSVAVSARTKRATEKRSQPSEQSLSYARVWAKRRNPQRSTPRDCLHATDTIQGCGMLEPQRFMPGDIASNKEDSVIGVRTIQKKGGPARRARTVKSAKPALLASNESVRPPAAGEFQLRIFIP